MSKYGLNELRELFLAFFEEKGHLRLDSFSLVPRNDPSLLLINAGMAPMKTWFTGEQEPPSKRICTCQKCLRTGDIDRVGKTSRHGTYFEMLGNFSFGDYFKREAILWCWEFLTKRLGLDKNLLYPSVYDEDDEAYDIWVNDVGLAPERVSKLGREDNYWDHGSGPCGPCSEVYFDRGDAYKCNSEACVPGCDCDRFVEIWNNVFTQFDNDGAGNYTELSQKNIDTGMGLERLACICQGVDSVFDIDTILPIVNKVSEISGTPYGKLARTDVSIRIITDHSRATTMMICDGILPSNEGRGYVLRRLLRRAARQGRLLGINDLFLHEVCKTVINENKGAYPELVEKYDFILRVIKAEEESFARTIDSGTALLNKLIDNLKEKGETVLSGEDAFKLGDTYGFPLDLTFELLAEHEMTVDYKAFDKLMDEQRARARKARETLGDLAWAGNDFGLDNTPTSFVGYEHLSTPADILAIVTQDELGASLLAGDEGVIVLDKTPFYAEMGGQSADFGTIIFGDNTFDVTNVQVSKGDKYMHHGKMRIGTLSVDDPVIATVDLPRRSAIMRAHTATHLLHKALSSLLGDHVNQAGSLVEPDKIRFDFTHFSALTKEEIARIEESVNKDILEGFSVDIKDLSIDDAKAQGATALFGEKYGNVVRVVKMAESIELCGGTHLDNTAKIGAFSIVSESSIASGVRRIEAITGFETLNALKQAKRHLAVLGEILKANTPEEIADKLEVNLSALKDLRSKLDSALSKEYAGEARRLLTQTRDIGGLKVLTTVIDDVTIDVSKLRHIEETLRDLELGLVAVLATIKDDKLTIIAACGKAAIERGIKAGELIKEITKICDGSGGGKAEYAMGGGKDISKLKATLEAVDVFVRGKLGV
ncbi:MAG: alanine--tRNA ligase [Oscillospiraceae bacterium]|nr:alanine--tRNA ligase [Oscillospiraceae bacterium]